MTQPWRTWAADDAILLLKARESVVEALVHLVHVPANRETAQLFHELREIRDNLEALARKVSTN